LSTRLRLFSFCFSFSFSFSFLADKPKGPHQPTSNTSLPRSHHTLPVLKSTQSSFERFAASSCCSLFLFFFFFFIFFFLLCYFSCQNRELVKTQSVFVAFCFSSSSFPHPHYFLSFFLSSNTDSLFFADINECLNSTLNDCANG